jgi:hypothetical protein
MFGIVFKRVKAFWRFFMVVESAVGEYLEGAKAWLLAEIEGKQCEEGRI